MLWCAHGNVMRYKLTQQAFHKKYLKIIKVLFSIQNCYKLLSAYRHIDCPVPNKYIYIRKREEILERDLAQNVFKWKQGKVAFKFHLFLLLHGRRWSIHWPRVKILKWRNRSVSALPEVILHGCFWGEWQFIELLVEASDLGSTTL